MTNDDDIDFRCGTGIYRLTWEDDEEAAGLRPQFYFQEVDDFGNLYWVPHPGRELNDFHRIREEYGLMAVILRMMHLTSDRKQYIDPTFSATCMKRQEPVDYTDEEIPT